MRGTIDCIDAFEAAQRVDHSSWRGLLPRNITPSDVDYVIMGNFRFAISNGMTQRKRAVFMEYKTNTACWQSIPKGQRWFYEDIVAIGEGKIWAVCCHYQQPGELLDTLKDVVEFQIMYWKDGFIETGRLWPGRNLAPFVRQIIFDIPVRSV